MSDFSLHTSDVILVGTRAGKGPPAVLLHAGGERRQVWAPIAAVLAQAGHASVAYDLRGHGDSGQQRASHLPAHADDVAAMVETTNEASVLVGASLGGFAAILALADPALQDRVAGLILVDVVPDPPPNRTRQWLARFAGQLAQVPLVDDILGRDAQLRDAARRLRTPVLLVRGGHASPLTNDDIERFTKLVPHAEVATVDEGGHLLARDAPLELAAHVITFLRSEPVRARRIRLNTSPDSEPPRPGGRAGREQSRP